VDDLEVIRKTSPPLMVGGYAALAEGAWMGATQATDVLEPVSLTRPRLKRPVIPKPPRLRLRGVVGRELTIAEASFVLRVSFF
jgi:hypothetical protein